MTENETLKLIRMSDVAVEEIKWLWYPYVPFGKITVIQGDPGDGKTTAVLAMAAAVTTGVPLLGVDVAAEPINVIFQTAEDGLGDTVKPRLLQTGADCERVIVIDESERELSLSDARIERTITETGAKLFILDPLCKCLHNGSHTFLQVCDYYDGRYFFKSNAHISLRLEATSYTSSSARAATTIIFIISSVLTNL